MDQTEFNMVSFRNELALLLENVSEKELFFEALDLAAALHQGQKRRSGEPYIVHPCSVVKIIASEFQLKDPEILASAMLHDLIEDVAGMTVEELQDRFGERVAHIVDGCTKIKANMPATKNRELTYNKLFTLAGENIEVFVVKLADRLHNMRTLEHLNHARRQRIARETLDYYAPIAARFGLFPLKRELLDLAIKYLYPRQSQKVIRRMANLEALPDAEEILAQLKAGLIGFPEHVQVRSRIKGLNGYYDPERKRLLQDPGENGTDVVIVLKCDDSAQCYHAMGISNRIHPPIPRTIRDFIANPKANGYESLHVRVNFKNRNYLFKIRTENMDMRARYGILFKWKPKEHDAGKPGPIQGITRTLKRIAHYDHGGSRRKEIVKGSEEIVAYTPKGTAIYLPKGSIVLDFAYQVHTDLGNRCTGATIQTERAPVTPIHRLKDGDIVHIRNSKKPIDLLDKTVEDKCRSDRARIALRNLVALQRRNFARVLGKDLIDKLMEKEGLSLSKIPEDISRQILEILNAKDFDDLYVQVGLGRYRSKIILFYLRDMLQEKEVPATEEKESQNIELKRLNLTRFKFSNCCNPYPGEESLVGILTEKGLSLHLPDCGELDRYQVESEDKFPIRWADSVLNQKIKGKLVLSKIGEPAGTLRVLEEWAGKVRYWDFTCHTAMHPESSVLSVYLEKPTVGHLVQLLARFPREQHTWKFKWTPLQKYAVFSPYLDPSEEFRLCS
jgi:guanosine-3',5'-bis(diphosphate) 3'-pyrophosphohydrolase